MKKLTKILSLVLAIFCLSLCFTGCIFSNDSLELDTPFKTTYIVGESLNVDGGILTYTHNETSTDVVITANMVDQSSFSTATTGTRKMIINYKGATLKVSYTVIDLFIQQSTLYGGTAILGDESGKVYVMFYDYGSKISVIYSQNSLNTQQVDWANLENDQGLGYSIVLDTENTTISADNQNWKITAEHSRDSERTIVITNLVYDSSTQKVTSFDMIIDNGPGFTMNCHLSFI